MIGASEPAAATPERIRRLLSGNIDELRGLGVVSLELFGSVVRGEAGKESDIDLLVEFARPVGLFHFFRVQHRLEEILGAPRVDMVERSAIHPGLREHILGEVVHVF